MYSMKDLAIDSDHWLWDRLLLFCNTYRMLKNTHVKYASVLLYSTYNKMICEICTCTLMYILIHTSYVCYTKKEWKTSLRTKTIYFWIVKLCVEINSNWLKNVWTCHKPIEHLSSQVAKLGSLASGKRLTVHEWTLLRSTSYVYSSSLVSDGDFTRASVNLCLDCIVYSNMGNQKYGRNHGYNHACLQEKKTAEFVSKAAVKLLFYLFSSGYRVVKLHYKTVANWKIKLAPPQVVTTNNRIINLGQLIDYLSKMAVHAATMWSLPK